MHLELDMGGWRSSRRRCMKDVTRSSCKRYRKDVTIYKGTHVKTLGYLDYNGRVKNIFRIPGTKLENNTFLIKITEHHSLFIKHTRTLY